MIQDGNPIACTVPRCNATRGSCATSADKRAGTTTELTVLLNRQVGRIVLPAISLLILRIRADVGPFSYNANI